MRRWVIAALAVTLVVGVVGCSENETFKVVFANRLPSGHNIDCYVNGTLLGSILPGATGEFSFDTRRINTGAVGESNHSADVVFAARDVSTGTLSQQIPQTIYTDRTAYVEINAGLF